MRRVDLGNPCYRFGWESVDTEPKHNGVIKEDANVYLVNNPLQFDEIYSKNLLEHLPDPGTFIKNAFDALTPGGRLTIITDNAEFIPFYFPFLLRHTGLAAHSRNDYILGNGFGHAPHYAVFTKLHLMNLLSLAGFHDVKVSRIGRYLGARLEATGIR